VTSQQKSVSSVALGFVIAVLILTACQRQQEFYSTEDFARIRKVDAHTHLNTLDETLINQAIADNFELLTINVDYPDFPPVPQQYDVALALTEKHPDTIKFAASFTSEDWEAPGHNAKVIEGLREARRRGAVAVKVWKNIGMDVRDSDGRLLMVDDSRLDPIFAFLESSSIPFIGHQGEPHNCWLPLDEMTVNNDREYFREHPQYHMFLHPEMPSYEEQMSARDRRLQRNGNIRFIGAHLASLEWSVVEMAAFLDRNPRAFLDMAARFGQLQYQSKRDLNEVRDFMIKYADRLIYATDATTLPDDDNREVAEIVRAKWLADWRYLTSDEVISVPEIDGEFKGLKLPAAVVDKIYYMNAKTAFAGDAGTTERSQTR
jgi:predicted TIM-barrel fold metal-dependent hydrolase